MPRKGKFDKYLKNLYIICMDKLTEGGTIFLDFVNSDNPEEIDRGIRAAIGGINLSILSIGIGLFRIKSEGLFKGLKCRNLGEYLDGLSKDTKKDKSTLYGWYSIGKAFIRHQEDLEQIGFSDKNGPTKLPYLDRALTRGDKDEVYKNLLNMPHNEFMYYAKSGKSKESGQNLYWENRGNIFYHRGLRAVIVNKSLSKRKTRMLKSAVALAFRALENKGHIVAVHLRNPKEARRFKIEALRIRTEMRRKSKGP